MQQSVYGFVVEPFGDRYNNTVKVGDKELILNSEIAHHQYVNRRAKVISTPKKNNTPISPGDELLIHHNVFRRWHNVHGEEKNSKSHFKDNKYIIFEDQIFLYNKGEGWQCLDGYCFVQPLVGKGDFADAEEPLKGVVVYSDGTADIDDIEGFTPNSEYEFIVDGVRLYRVLSKFITIKYERKGNEEAYNPSWAQSS